MKKRDLKYQSWMELLLALALLVVINVLSASFFDRIDFTKEKRFSLSKATKTMAKSLDDMMYVKVYLEGDDLSPGYKRLRNATREMLDEFRYASGNKLEYEFYNPLEGLDTKKQREVLQQLKDAGIQGMEIHEKTETGSRQKIVIPGAHFYYKNQEYPLYLTDPGLLINNPATIENAIEGLEYNIANMVRRCVQAKARRVAFIDGHFELSEIETADVSNKLSEFYVVERLNLNEDDTSFFRQFVEPLEKKFPQGLDKVDGDTLGLALLEQVTRKLRSFDCIVIAKPRIPFSKREKYFIDQYIMNGGKVVWLIDPLLAEMDSVGKLGRVYTSDYDLNLTDMLFKYGVRVNLDVVQDYNSILIPVASSVPGSKQYEPKPWIYFPIAAPTTSHPIVKNLDLVWFQFPASIDLVGSKDIRKEVLLHSSDRSHISSHPVEIDFNFGTRPQPLTYFNKQQVPLAVLVEGKFESFFKYVGRKDIDPTSGFKDHTDNGKMIVIADGDMIRNRYNRNGQIFPAGMERFSQKIFGNKQFFVNCVDYLCDDYGLIEVRTKEIKLRVLDKDKIDQPSERNYLKTMNMVLPVSFILLFGIVNFVIRKRKYER